MLEEVFDLIMKVHEGMHIVTIGLLDGTTIQRAHYTKGSSDTIVELTLNKKDVEYVSFNVNNQ